MTNERPAAMTAAGMGDRCPARGAGGCAPASEPTAIGEQLLVAGIAPIRTIDRLALRAAAPMLPTKPQKPLDIGLFDLAARNQLELFGGPS